MKSGKIKKQKNITEKKELDQGFWPYVKRQYKKNKIAVLSLYLVYFLVVMAIFADFLANEKPIIAKYKGKVTSPVLTEYLVDLGLGTWAKEYQNVNWKEIDFEFSIWPPIPYLPQNLDLMNTRVSPFKEQNVKSLHWRHWLGTDDLGRDILAGMLHAIRIALSVGVIAMGIASVIGIFFGALAGYFGDQRIRISRIRLVLNLIFLFLALFYGFGVRSYILADAIGYSMLSFLKELMISLGIIIIIITIGNMLVKPLKKFPYLAKKVNIPLDMIISRLIEIMVSIPHLILIISIVAISKPSIYLIMAVIGFTSWTGIARFIRAEMLRVRSLEYIEASRALGFSDFRILLKHAIPNSLSPVLIAIAFGIASAILVESTLSFLGIGVPTETVTWGSLLSAARKYSQDWWLAIFPGFAIFITVTIFNLIGEGLTDALDPRLKK